MTASWLGVVLAPNAFHSSSDRDGRQIRDRVADLEFRNGALTVPLAPIFWQHTSWRRAR